MYSKIPLIAAALTALAAFMGSPNAKMIAGGTGGPPGSTGGSTGLGTTGGAGGGFTSSGNVINIVNILERRSADTYGYFDTGSGPTWQTLSGRHCVGMQFHSVSWTFSGPTPPANVSQIIHSESIYVSQDSELGSVASGWAGSPPSGVPALGEEVRGGLVNAGTDIVIQTSGTGAIGDGRHLKFYKLTIDETIYNDGTATSYDPHWYGADGEDSPVPYDYVLHKIACDDSSITTRKTYGQPNAAGEYPADANAPLRPINYGPWEYKGGLFVGNMPSGSSDSSGTSRILFFPNSSGYDASLLDGTHDFAALSIYDKGKPSTTGTSGAMTVGIFFPATTDSNLTSVTESTARWDNQWNITPLDAGATYTDFTQHPYAYTTLTDGNSDDYVCLRMGPAFGYNLNQPTTTCLTGICLAIVSESTVVSADTQCWHYFGSKEYAAKQSSFPGNDCFPRVWLVEPAS